MTGPGKRSPVPRESRETARQAIAGLLSGEPLSALDLSGRVGIPEKEVCGHLEHIRRTVGKGKARLVVKPAECRSCGFTFRKRDRLERPGRCPVCKGESISAPLFSIAGAVAGARTGRAPGGSPVYDDPSGPRRLTRGQR